MRRPIRIRSHGSCWPRRITRATASCNRCRASNGCRPRVGRLPPPAVTNRTKAKKRARITPRFIISTRRTTARWVVKNRIELSVTRSSMTLRSAFISTFSLTLLRTAAFAQAPADSPILPDAEIHKILADRIGSENLGIGIVVGVIDAKGRRIVSDGSLAKDDKRPLNGDTVFEIGSMTKVFTSLVLMDMVQKGEVALTDPVSKYLPASVKVPERNGRMINLQDLSTQSSGLPRMPSNFNPKDPLNPYADYSVEQLYQFLSGYQLKRDIGAKYEYSNLGVGLLGHVLSLR